MDWTREIEARGVVSKATTPLIWAAVIGLSLMLAYICASSFA